MASFWVCIRWISGGIPSLRLSANASEKMASLQPWIFQGVHGTHIIGGDQTWCKSISYVWENPVLRALRIPKNPPRFRGRLWCHRLKGASQHTWGTRYTPHEFHMKHIMKIMMSENFKTSLGPFNFAGVESKCCQSCCRKSCFELAGFDVVLDSLPWIPTLSPPVDA